MDGDLKENKELKDLLRLVRGVIGDLHLTNTYDKYDIVGIRRMIDEAVGPDPEEENKGLIGFAHNLERDAKLLIKAAKDRLLGKKICITSNYNGQLHGKSKPSLNGQILIVADIVLLNGGMSIFPRKPHDSRVLPSVELREFYFCDDEED